MTNDSAIVNRTLSTVATLLFIIKSLLTKNDQRSEQKFKLESILNRNKFTLWNVEVIKVDATQGKQNTERQ